MTRILIPNAYTWYNKGDASIIVGMIGALRKHIPNADITLLSFTPEVDGEKYKKYDVKVLRSLLTLSPTDDSPKLVKGIRLIAKVLEYSLWAKLRFPVNSNEREILDTYADADIVVSCGGGFLGGYGIIAGLVSFLHLYGIYFAKLVNKPVIIYGQSIEQFGNALISSVTKFVLNRVDLITVREGISLDYLKSLGIKPKVILTADAAFLVKSISSEKCLRLLAEENVYASQRPLVGMTVRKWNFPEYSDGKTRFSNYLEVMTATIEWLISNMNATVALFPHVIWSPKDDDRIVSSEIVSRIKNKANIRVLTKDYSPEELKGIIGQMDLFIGTRMHSNIFALSNGIPTIAISYQKKTDGIMNMLGMAEYVLDMANLRFDHMVRLIQVACNSRESISSSLKSKIREVQNQALYNAKLVRDMVDSNR